LKRWQKKDQARLTKILILIRLNIIKMPTLEELRKLLEKERKDLIELKMRGDLTEKGEGMLIVINAIFEEMGWEIDD